jgi:hypothetical protein
LINGLFDVRKIPAPQAKRNIAMSLTRRNALLSLRPRPRSIWDAVILGFVLIVHAVMAALGWFVMSNSLQDSALNISVQGLGIVMGFWIGMWVSPSSPKQRGDLTSLAKSVTAFISGYVFSKVDPLISRSLSAGSFDPITMFRVLSFLSSLSAQALLVSLMSWYNVRPMSDERDDHVESMPQPTTAMPTVAPVHKS